MDFHYLIYSSTNVCLRRKKCMKGFPFEDLRFQRNTAILVLYKLNINIQFNMIKKMSRESWKRGDFISSCCSWHFSFVMLFITKHPFPKNCKKAFVFSYNAIKITKLLSTIIIKVNYFYILRKYVRFIII